MKILITGITGYIGRHLTAFWQNKPDFIITGIGSRFNGAELLPSSTYYIQADITDAKAIAQIVAEVQPDVLIHSAAISKPNDCEAQKQMAEAINIDGTKIIAKAAADCKSYLLFLSSDMVFGNNGPYLESDQPCPVNYYGVTKQIAEEWVLRICPKAGIARTVLVYGAQLPGGNPTFLQWAASRLQMQVPTRIFTDQLRTATFVQDLVKGLATMAENKKSGIYHLCGEEVWTPYQLALQVATYLGKSVDCISPVTMEEWQEIAARPMASTLRIDKAIREIGFTTTPLQQALPLIF